MKKIGDIYTARGRITENESEAGNPARIILFDGRFDTAYKIESFRIWSSSVSGSEPYVVGKLSTSDNLTNVQAVGFFNAADSREIAWSVSAGATDGGQHTLGDFIIDPDNLVVEDLYVYGRANSDLTPINYLITMQKYDITDWEGALTMAKDRAQDSV